VGLFVWVMVFIVVFCVLVLFLVFGFGCLLCWLVWVDAGVLLCLDVVVFDFGCVFDL